MTVSASALQCAEQELLIAESTAREVSAGREAMRLQEGKKKLNKKNFINNFSRSSNCSSIAKDLRVLKITILPTGPLQIINN